MSKQETLTFRAGVARYDEETKVCTPLPAAGQVVIRPSDEEEMGFYEFEWTPTERPLAGAGAAAGAAAGEGLEPISLILIPGETLWVRVASARHGRVFALVFSSNQKYFFWLQERNRPPLGPADLSPRDQEVYEQILRILAFSDDDEQEAKDSNTNTNSNSNTDRGTPDFDEDSNDAVMADAAA